MYILSVRLVEGREGRQTLVCLEECCGVDSRFLPSIDLGATFRRTRGCPGVGTVSCKQSRKLSTATSFGGAIVLETSLSGA